MVLSKDPIQLLWPIDLKLLVHQTLSSFEMTDPGKAILFLGVVHLVAIHLAAQPLTPVDANLDLEGKPALEPQTRGFISELEWAFFVFITRCGRPSKWAG